MAPPKKEDALTKAPRAERWRIHLQRGRLASKLIQCLHAVCEDNDQRKSQNAFEKQHGALWVKRWEAASRRRAGKVQKGRTRIEDDPGKTYVDIVFSSAVTWQSPCKVVRDAKKKMNGVPLAARRQCTVGNPEPNPTITDAAPPPAVPADSATLPPAKKRRLRGKTSEAALAAAASPSAPPRSPASAASSARAASLFLPPPVLVMKLRQLMSVLRQLMSARGLQRESRFQEKFAEPTGKSKLEVSWDTSLASGTVGKVYPGHVRGTHYSVAIKMLRMRSSAEVELSRCVAVAKHPDIVTILDVGFFFSGG